MAADNPSPALRLQTVLDSIEEPMYIIDRQHLVVYANRVAGKRAGGTKGVLLGKSCHLVIFDQPAACPFCQLESVFAAGKSSKTNFSLLDTDGKNHVMELSFYPIQEPGQQVDCCLVMSRDISENVGLFAEISRLKGLAAMGKYAAELTHEIRNPLNSIEIQMMLLKRLIQNLPTDKQSVVADIVEVVRTENQRLNSLANDFLMIKKSRELTMSQVEVSSLLQEVVSLLAEEAAGQQVALTLVAGQRRFQIRGDRDKLKQAFVNLAKNAIEALAGLGDGRLTMMVNEENGLARVEFSDNGPGIPYEKQPKIFNLFYTTKVHGTGIGLYVCRDIIEAHGGTLSFMSDEKGTSFVLRLPMIEGA
ncbi:MAG: PAS domain-containing sensor histidine kinase [Deltaproteobacteria bacterium]|nr:PAS domain-containing sensor histidine kinase [Candidatus Anaeroferrophillus wilburensis]MBN2889598.1 PAS domain-containing sensor histidine kinase [Deltaproteobacteria bacterium]